MKTSIRDLIERDGRWLGGIRPFPKAALETIYRAMNDKTFIDVLYAQSPFFKKAKRKNRRGW